MQHTQFLVVGLGIAGTLVSHELWKAGKDFIVIDDVTGPPKASMVAGAVINPININKWEPVQNSEHFIPHAIATYKQFESLLNTKLVDETAMLVFQSKEADPICWQKNKNANPFILDATEKDKQLIRPFFKHFAPVAKVSPVWKINAGNLITHWQSFLREKKMLIEGRVNADECAVTPAHVTCKNILAEKIIFCEGAAASQNTFFQKLPFTKNRGEALLIAIPHLPDNYIYHNGIRLVPAGEQLFWCGSNYQWQFSDLSPDGNWRKNTVLQLQQWLKLPFTIEDHIVAERPTSAGQALFMGVHPAMPSVAILNGLGTKGFSAGPVLAKQLCNQWLFPEQYLKHELVKPLSKWLS